MKKTIYILILLFFVNSLYANEKKCVYINSYHNGYSWSDSIKKEIKLILKDTCVLSEFNLNSKQNTSVNYIKAKALEAKKLIEKIKPDIVIVSDDNAAKYLVKPYFKNSEIPFVFCGINWNADEYGFSNKNITGMLEVLPIQDLYKLAISLSKGNKALFIGDNSITDKKDLDKFISYSKFNKINLDHVLANDISTWKKSFLNAQEQYDFIILGHNSAVKNWNDEEMKSFVLKNSKILVFSTYSWMMPFSMVGLIIKAKEQGVWAGTTAKAILNGSSTSQIPVTTNKTWNSYVNVRLLKSTNIKLPLNLMAKSKKID